MNSFGHIFRVHSFGESHGPAMGVVIDGCPAGLEFDDQLLEKNLSRRRPGQSSIVSSRDEKENYKILSGIYQGKTLGTPIAILVENQNQRPQDYLNKNGEAQFVDRPGHADDVWKSKFGNTDPRGGGRASGRETLSRVLAGSVAQMLVKHLSPETRVASFVHSIADVELNDEDYRQLDANFYSESAWDDNATRIPNKEKNDQVYDLLVKAKTEGKSYGGVARVKVLAPPSNLGQPVFRKLKSELSAAYMSVGAVVGVELGVGFKSAKGEGSHFHQSKESDVYGGIRGGISTGETIDFKVAFKPTSSVLDVAKKGRHDPCIVPRAVSVLEAMTYLVLADQLLMQRLDKI